MPSINDIQYPHSICDCSTCPNQWIFLGASVVNFSCNQGWSQEASSLSVTLVEDSCVKTKYYLDNLLVVNSSSIADPGFLGRTYNIAALPVLFKFESFEYCGIVQSYQIENSTSGRALITVNIVSPSQILENVNVILDKYLGSVYGVPNVINIYGFYEDSANCETYGYSDNINKGMPWSRFYGAFSVLTSSIPSISNDYCYGRVRLAPGVAYGYGCIPENDVGYLIDLSELDAVCPTDYRLTGAYVNLMDIITEVADASASDYFIELIPVNSGGNIYKFIKVRIANRSTQPSIGQITTFIGLKTAEECGAVSYNTGLELRNELTNVMLLGPNRHQMYYVSDIFFTEDGNLDYDEMSGYYITPYWGIYKSSITDDTIAIPTRMENYEFFFDLDLTDMRGELRAIDLGENAIFEISETELIAASIGLDYWRGFLSSMSTDLDATLAAIIIAQGVVNSSHVYEKRHMINILRNNPNASTILRGFHLLNLKSNRNNIPFELISNIDHDLELIYQRIISVFDEFYGKKFLIKIPELCVYEDQYGDIRKSRDISDGGWNEENDIEYTNLLDIDTTSEISNFFRLEDGRFRPFVKFTSPPLEDSGSSYFCVTLLNQDEYGYVWEEVEETEETQTGDEQVTNYYQHMWVKCNTEDDFVYMESGYQEPRAIIELPDIVYGNCNVESGFEQEVYAAHMAVANDAGTDHPAVRALFKNVGGATNSRGGRIKKSEFPTGATIALINNQSVYGPWYSGTLGSTGKTEIIEDSDLVPWFFGNFNDMNIVAQYTVDSSISNMQFGEYGTVVLPGWPVLKLGDELLAYNGSGVGYITGQNLFDTRVINSGSYTIDSINYTFYKINLITAGYWQGTFGPSITGISVNVSESGATTTYNLRTYTKQFGQFSKYHTEKMKDFGRMKQRLFKNYLTKQYNSR